MACYARKVVETAIAEIGYQETPKGSNKNKYAKFIDKNFPNFYNGKKDSVAWCDVFVDYCVLVNCDGEAEAEYVLCQPKKSCGAGCSFSYNYYKEKGRVGNEAKIGSQIFFGTGKKPSHTGIVIDVTDTSVITVEGNSDDSVKKHTYKKESSRIFGYGYPRYTEAEVSPAPAQPSEPSESPVTPSVRTMKVKTNSGLPLRMRREPNTTSDRILSIPNGKTVQVLDVVEGEKIAGNTKWASCSYDGKTGYCSMAYLK